MPVRLLLRATGRVKKYALLTLVLPDAMIYSINGSGHQGGPFSRASIPGVSSVHSNRSLIF